MHNLNFYSTSLLKQQSTGRHVAPLRYIMILSNKFCCVLCGKAANTNLKSLKFDLTQPGLKHMTYHRGEHANHAL